MEKRAVGLKPNPVTLYTILLNGISAKLNVKQLYGYYAFGYNYNILTNLKTTNTTSFAIDIIENYLTFIKEHQLLVTLKALDKDFDGILEALKKKNGKEALGTDNASKILKLVKAVDKTLDSELKLRDAYILTEKRLGLNNILNNIGILFADGLYNKLPDISKTDFAEAGKCIAFERPTAAAFHILRGTEAVLKFYYEKIVKKKRLSNPMWGPMIDQLKNRKDTPKHVLDALDNIRENFRNPTLHPEVNYVLDEAQDLFSVCVDGANRLIRDLEKKKLIT